jgi:hypothetical protein
MSFTSASKVFVGWLQKSIYKFLKLHGHVVFSKRASGCYQLRYAKNEGIALVVAMYYRSSVIHLSRKYLKIKQSLAIVQKQKRVALTK